MTRNMEGKTFYDEENKLWYAPDPLIIFNPKNNLANAILWTLTNNPEKVVQISHETNIQITAGFMKQQMIRAAANLQKLGYKEGDVFGFMARNSHHLAPIVYASLCLACPVSTLDPSLFKPEILHMISTTKPKVMFCDVDVYDLVHECLNELKNDVPIYTFNGSTHGSIPVEQLFEDIPEANEFTVAQIDGENTTAAILCTSGSTGLPKRVCLSHSVLLLSATSYPAKSEDILLCFSTIYWISGLSMCIDGGIRGLLRIITTQSFNPELLLEIIETHRVTYFISASFYLVVTLRSKKFHQTELSSVKIIMCGGTKLSNSTALEMAKNLPNGEVKQIYGLTEVGGSISCAAIRTPNDTSVGQLLWGIQTKIVDDDGNRLGVNQSGEICAKSKFKFLGYFNNDEANSSAIDDEDFLRTGDVGYFDDNGNLHLVDRKKEMIKYYGFQISPTEIEQFFIQFDSIKAVCVVGIPDPKASDIDLPAAVVILNETSSTLLTGEEIKQLVADKFADFKRLRGGVYFVESMPLTASGKVIRRQVKTMAMKLYAAT